MAKSVIVVASGETERRALPHLVAHLSPEGIVVKEVRIPPLHRPLNVRMVERIIKAAWYENIASPPDKFVLVLDLDGKDPGRVLSLYEKQLPSRLAMISADVVYAYAQEHLEAWFFADPQNMRRYLRRQLGRVDVSRPDNINNPKNHLKNLLSDRVYTARISEDIARELNPNTMRRHSPSFRLFLDRVTNGSSGSTAS